MTVYYTPVSTWNDFNGGAWTDLVSWYNPTGYFSPGIELIVTSDIVDLGSTQWVVPRTSVAAVNTTSDNSFVVSYLVSTNGQDYTETSPGPLQGRYIRTQVVTTVLSGREGIQSVTTTFDTPPTSIRFDDIDTSTLNAADPTTQAAATALGITAAKTIDVSDRFAKITGVAVDANVDDPRLLAIRVVDSTASNFTFGLIDLDTWGKVSVDGDINITITGLPQVDIDFATGSVTPRD